MKRTDRILYKMNTPMQADLDLLRDEDLVKLAQAGDSDAEHALTLRFMSLVRIKARPYFLIGADKSDLVQEGAIGLLNAMRDYNADRHVSFRSFAEVCINRQILSAIKSATRQKHIPLNSYISLDKPAYGDYSGSSSTLADTLVCVTTTNPEELAVNKESANYIIDLLENDLTELEANVLGRFLNGQSYSEIARELGRSNKAVDNALQRIKKKLLRLFETQNED